jgi:hypothetical protein
MDGLEYAAVSEQTVLQHMREPWKWKTQQMYFCSNPECPVVYFGKDGSTIDRNALRTAVGIKDASDQAMICYCFGITHAEAEKNPALKDYVVSQTRKHLCACEIRNPSGKCCLKNFPR